MRLRIRSIRKQLKWSQTELALRAGVRTATISEIETGKRSPDLATLEAVAAAFPCSVLDLFEVDEGDPSDAAAVIAGLSQMSPEERAGVMSLIRGAVRSASDADT